MGSRPNEDPVILGHIALELWNRYHTTDAEAQRVGAPVQRIHLPVKTGGAVHSWKESQL